ncbi:ankyrin repeat protein [Pandoravirus inopinatum]|uniref:Ankyrin repeat protein n=1 Tax=Pandoravirus inopinatum TaxID=1605721 RepID=A0A0B5J0K6_9VIRU|nr:ankyrin repeat protein [Pandoravirus inopinatum]AJF97004.1 ankyrin repeat protein [Pandoravirus inopinatum]
MAAAGAGHTHCIEYLGVGASVSARNLSEAAAANGRLNVLRWLDDIRCAWKSARVVLCAAAGGHHGCLDYALVKGCPASTQAVEAAAAKGHAESMRRLLAPDNDRSDTVDKSDSAVATAAARGGHLDCLIYAHESGWAWSRRTTTAAAKAGRIECLAYAHENGCVWSTRTARAAAKRGHLDCLRYAHEKGCACDSHTVDCAVRGGHAACLDYLLGVAVPGGADAETWWLAAACGRVACLDVLRVHAAGRNRAEYVCEAAIAAGHHDVLLWMIANLNYRAIDKEHRAARLGRLECLRVVAAVGPQQGDASIAAAASGGHTECIKYLRDKGFPMDARACEAAAGGGHLECLTFLREVLGCAWDERACIAAAAAGRVDCLAYLHRNGCPWAHDTVSAAIKRGRVACLTYALDNECVHDAYAAAVEAIDRGRTSCLDALCRAGAPLDQHLLAKCIRSGQSGLIKVLARHGCPRGALTCHDARDCEDARVLCTLYKLGFPWGPSRRIMGRSEDAVSRLANPCAMPKPRKEGARRRRAGKANRRGSPGGMLTIALVL